MDVERQAQNKSSSPEADADIRNAGSGTPMPDRDDDSLTIRSDVNDRPQAGDLEKAELENASLQIEGPVPTTFDQNDDFVEGGFEGWKVILGCALISGPSVGWNLIWGVFQQYHSTHFLAGTPSATLSVIGSLQNALMMVLAFVTGKLGDRYGYKPFIGAGCIVVFISQLSAAFCTELWSIFITQGVLQGVGCGLLLPMIMALPSQWFKKRRGVATGIVIAGSSFGGAVPSLIVKKMLTTLSFRKTLLIYSFVQGAVMLAGFLLIKVRTPTSRAAAKSRKIQWVDKQYFKDLKFWSICLALFFALFGYMTPFVFISVYTGEKLPNISAQLANLPIPIMSFASAIGRTTVGLAADRIGFINAFILVISISAFSQVVLWNVAAESYAGIMVFSVVFGLTGPCFLSLVTPIAATLYGTQNLATITGLLNLANVPGLLSGPPIGGVILDGSGHNWHALATYSGVIQFVSVICILYARFRREPRLFARI
ncbi:MFS general substrate transporter [Ceratobasidium sp. AG-I]|nr:MFS general substrate transporter [Ceratobasidium sp. AG-I]